MGGLRRGAGARSVGRGFRAEDAARRAARHLRSAGHRLHRVDGSQPRSRRGPDHLSARPHAAEHAGRRDRPRLLDVRHELHLRALRRGHRHLLGANTRPRTAGTRAATPAARRLADARARCERRRLGLPVRAQGQHRTDGSGRTAGPAGLHGSTRAAGRRRRRRSRLARRFRAAVPDRHRSGSAGRLRADARRHYALGPRRKRGSRCARARARRTRIRAARTRLCQGPHRSRAERRHGGRGRRARPARRCRARPVRARHPPRRRRLQRHRRSRRRHRRDAHRLECARRDPCTRSADRHAAPTRRRPPHPHLRPIGSDPRIGRDA